MVLLFANPAKTKWFVLAALVFLLGLAFRLAVVDNDSLWHDELTSVAFSTGHLEYCEESGNEPFANIKLKRLMQHEQPPLGIDSAIKAVQVDGSHPPLYILILYVWTLVFGTSDVALRLLSMLCWALCFPLLWMLCRQISNRTAATIACTLFAFAPPSVYYSVEARMYSMVWLFSLSNAYFAMQLHRRGLHPMNFALWVASGACGFLTHYFFVIPFTAICAWLTFAPGRFKRLHFFAGILLIGLLILPWYINAREYMAISPGRRSWLKGLPQYAPAYTLPIANYLRHFLAMRDDFLHLGYALKTNMLAVLAIATSIVGLVLSWRKSKLRHPRVCLLYWLLGITSCGPILLDSVLRSHIAEIYRYYTAGILAAFMLFAIGITAFRRGIYRFVPLCMLLVSFFLHDAGLFDIEARHSEPYREVDRYLITALQPTDVVLIQAVPAGVLGIARYLPDEVLVLPHSPLCNGQLRPEALKRLSQNHNRIFLVNAHNTPEGELERWLRANSVKEEVVPPLKGTITIHVFILTKDL